MDANWNFCLKAILAQEGGNDDDPHDPGGRTSRGIIQREYDAWCRSCNKPTRDVWLATDEEVAEIYHWQYWAPYCPSFPPGIDLTYFDMAVNAGPVRSMKILQSALGVTPDGHYGVVTATALGDADPGTIINRFANGRLAFYRGLKTFKYFGRGWTRRTEEIRAQAQQLIR